MGSFDDWYASYPKKQGKEAAKRTWKRMNAAERAACVAAQPMWNAHWASEGTQFCPMASTWVNQKRWEDDIPNATPARRANNSDITRDNAARVLARYEGTQ